MAATITTDARRKANLRVLQRIDSSILDIAGSATHVVLYEFNNAEQKWQKIDVEGSLFLSKRSDAPRFKLVVMNRNSRDNFDVPITGKFQMQVRDPYLIFREEKGVEGSSGSSKILGIWFHDDSEREAVSALLMKIVESLAKIEEMETQHAANGKQILKGNGEGSGASDIADTVARSTVAVDEDAAASALLSPLSLSQQAVSPEASASNTAPNDPKNELSTQKFPHQNLVLDKKSLQLSLLSLIQDERFLDLIHAQYLKVAHARANRNSGTQQRGEGSNVGGKRGVADHVQE